MSFPAEQTPMENHPDDDTVDPVVLRERLSHVEMLLSNVEDTENAAADEHVSVAERAVSSVLERLEQD